MHDEISTDLDWIRDRDERLEREIREQERFVDQEIRQREIRESEQHYEATAKRHSRIRAQLSYETPYEPAVEGEELRYVVNDEDQQQQMRYQEDEIHHVRASNLQVRSPMDTAVAVGATGGPSKHKQPSNISKKKSPKSPRKSRNPGVPDTETAMPSNVEEKPAKRHHHKEKKSHRNKGGGNVEGGGGSNGKTGNKGEKAATSGSSGPSRSTRSRTDSTRRSIRRQATVHDDHHLKSSNGGGRKSSKIPEEASGGAISGADLSDVFDEESQHQYYPPEDEMKYMEDRSNCRKK